MRGAVIRRAGVIFVVGALLSAPSVSGAAIRPAAGALPITSPIVSFAPSAQLDCTTANERNDWLKFFSSNASNPAALSCATIVSVSGAGLFGPRSFTDRDGMLAGRPVTPFTFVSQTVAASRGGSRLKAVTLVVLPGTGLLLRQTDAYVNGESTVTTRVELGTLSTTARDVVIYRTGDCFPGSDPGFGITRGKAAGCEQAVQDGLNAVPVAGPAFMRWAPTRGASHYAVGPVEDVRAAIGAGLPLADSCDCATPQDIAAALSWSVRVVPGHTTTVAHRLTYSPQAGRDRTTLVARTTVKQGVTRLIARLTSSDGPVAGAPIEFAVGSLVACTAITGNRGRATCTYDGAAPDFVARYRGDARLRPSSASVAADPQPPPPPDPPGFPACGHFDRALGGLATGGDAHHYSIGVSTDAPPCPIVRYTAYQGADVIGQMRGDLRATNFLGETVPGFVVMFIDSPFGIVPGPCLSVSATDTRTGEILDTYPGPVDLPCLVTVAGQKFR